MRFERKLVIYYPDNAGNLNDLCYKFKIYWLLLFTSNKFSLDFNLILET